MFFTGIWQHAIFKLVFRRKKWTVKCGSVLSKFPKWSNQLAIMLRGWHFLKQHSAKEYWKELSLLSIVAVCTADGKGSYTVGPTNCFFSLLGQNKPKQIPKNKIIYVCHWVMRLSSCKTNAWQIVLGKAQGQATGCAMTVLNQTHGEGNFGDICTKIWTVLNFCKQIINAIVFNMKFLCEGSLYL